MWATRRIWAAAFLVMVVLAGGCARPYPSKGAPVRPGGPAEGGTLHLSLPATPRGLFNPVLYEDAYDGAILDLVFDGLLTVNERLEYVCNLCRSMEISPDHRTLTFRLKPGVRWHDGAPFTAEDVAFTVRTILHPDYTGVRTRDFAALLGVEKMLKERARLAEQVRSGQISSEEAGRLRRARWEAWLRGDGARAIQVVDPLTIVFTMEQPYAPILQSLAIKVMPKHIFETVPVGELARHPATRKPVGTGPYRFVEYRPDQYVKLERFDRYHRGTPRIHRVIYRIVNQDVAVAQLLAGEIDAARVRPEDLDLLRKDPAIRIHVPAVSGYQYMGLNHDHPILREKTVRQALAYGIDRQGIVDRLLRGHGEVVSTHLSPATWAYDLSVLNSYPYDPDKARRLLAQAGWRERNQEGILIRDGQPFRFTLKYPSGNAVREAAAQLIQANLRELGIQVDLQMMEFGTLIREVFDRRNMDAWLMGWVVGIDPDPGAIFLPDSKWGRVTGWRNARSEALIRQGVRTLLPAQRRLIYTEWARLINEELPFIFLYSEHELEAVRTDRIRGLRPDARGALWNIWELWIPPEKQ